MLPPEQLLQVLKTAPLIQFEGWVYRIVAEEYREAPIEIIGSFIAGGRYNISQRFGVLYTADSRETALTEVQHFFETSPQLNGAPRNPELILSLKCKLSRVLDLTDASIVEALGTSFEELVAPRFIAEAEEDPELASIRTTWKQLTPTQQLGLACFQSRNISALKAPSAACKAARREGFCIDMLFDNFVQGEFVEVYDSTGRITQSKKAGDKNILDPRN